MRLGRDAIAGLALGWLAALLIAAPALAESPAIKGLKLGMSLADGEIEAVYQTVLASEVADSVGLTFPYDHIETSLTDGSRLSLHFSAPSAGSRLFWIRLSTSWYWPVEREAPALDTLLAGYEERFGTPTRSLGPRTGEGDLLLVFATPGTSADLPAEIAIGPTEIGGVQFLSYQQRVALFGRNFTGSIVSIVMRDGKVAAAVEELVDHTRAATVLNPGS
jgi:hypothetical protein